MYQLIVRLLFAIALIQLGLSATNIRMVEKRSRDILKINWRPISVFPEEARRFK